MTDCQYVRDYYDVPACIGRAVIVDGKPGVIAADKGNHIGVNFDEDKPGVIKHCHPTWRVEYGEMRDVRKMTRAQRTYREYLSSEVDETFAEWMGFRRKA